MYNPVRIGIFGSVVRGEILDGLKSAILGAGCAVEQ
jgi:hypothetical protein